jgi:hypothetical protein
MTVPSIDIVLAIPTEQDAFSIRNRIELSATKSAYRLPQNLDSSFSIRNRIELSATTIETKHMLGLLGFQPKFRRDGS